MNILKTEILKKFYIKDFEELEDFSPFGGLDLAVNGMIGNMLYNLIEVLPEIESVHVDSSGTLNGVMLKPVNLSNEDFEKVKDFVNGLDEDDREYFPEGIDEEKIKIGQSLVNIANATTAVRLPEDSNYFFLEDALFKDWTNNTNYSEIIDKTAKREYFVSNVESPLSNLLEDLMFNEYHGGKESFAFLMRYSNIKGWVGINDLFNELKA